MGGPSDGMRRFIPPREIVRDAALSIGFTVATGAASAVAERGPWYSWCGVALTGWAALYFAAGLRPSVAAWLATRGMCEVEVQVISDIRVLTYPTARQMLTTGDVTPLDQEWDVVLEVVRRRSAVTYALHEDGQVEVLVSA